MQRAIITLTLICCCSIGAVAKQFNVVSPNGRLRLDVQIDTSISFTLKLDNKPMLVSPQIAMTLQGGETLGKNPVISRTLKRSVDETIDAFLHRRAKVNDCYNELQVRFKGNYGIIFRVYDDGAVYRFTIKRPDTLFVENETVCFDFGQDLPVWIGYSTGKENNRFQSSFQNVYSHEKISDFDNTNIAFLPALVDLGDNLKACIIEADLEDYPGMFIRKKDGTYSYEAVFAPYAKTEVRTQNRCQQIITESEPFIAKTEGNRLFPWRGVVISSADVQLADNDMVYRLGAPSRIDDVSWIKPGKAAWEWWNDWGISQVGFEAGINNETYLHYIDFAAENGLQYVIIDEGWSPPKEGNIMKVIPRIDLPMLVNYARERNVDLILWAVWNVLDDKLDEACRYYSSLGIKGFKIDFMDRDDQNVVNFIYRCAEACGRHKLIVDYHGMYKPTGVQRTYPNILNFEGVFGAEELKWSNPDMPSYDVTFPFIRMMAGPVDYTQGAMKNANKQNFRSIYSEPMSQGTRCHQLATYIVFDSPLVMLADSPTNYRKEQECTNFIAAIPTVFDNTFILDGKVGEYIVSARKKDNSYYVGALSNWDARSLQIDLSFLPDGDFRATIFSDGTNAGKVASDYVKTEIPVNNQLSLTINMAAGGGWACMISE